MLIVMIVVDCLTTRNELLALFLGFDVVCLMLLHLVYV